MEAIVEQGCSTALCSNAGSNSDSVFSNRFFEPRNRSTRKMRHAGGRDRSHDRFIEAVNLSNLVRYGKQLTLMILLCTAAGCVSNHQAERAAYRLRPNLDGAAFRPCSWFARPTYGTQGAACRHVPDMRPLALEKKSRIAVAVPSGSPKRCHPGAGLGRACGKSR